ncbi:MULTISPECIES: HlyD family secretion protein [Cupriavidus]|jgi:multidrug resistance efflux pump|uniref:Multidrug transporter n=1 Tax=Cupriavidus metallidurans TaxID=119219 RepID=A0A482IQ38_9BURK|nr:MULTISPECIES: multidrug transporter [Cupriavidus]KWR78295.1 multidrug transporter [Cupriavidus sp. SHE]QBP09707.1 multidrug transporter [Cupriavidus metallidurans]QWC90058.1 multidrug transporter [Cupriavidus metallidurans]
MDKKVDQKDSVPARVKPSQHPPHHDSLMQRRAGVPGLPLWRVVPRLASYGMVVFIIWVVLSVMFPYIFTRSSERAIVNSPVTLVTTPVEGVVTKQVVTVGGSFNAGDPLMALQNPNMDRALLVELTGKQLDNQKRLEAAKVKLEADQTRMASTGGDIKRYAASADREHASRVRGIEARLAVAKQQIDAQEDVVNRNQAMQWAGAVSQAYTDASRNQLTVLAGSRDAIQAELDSARNSSEAARSKVFSSSADGALGALSQKQDELKAEITQTQAEITQLEQYGAEVDKLVTAEQERLERVSNLDIKAYASGIVEDVLTPPGTRVAAGATLMRTTNCSQPNVVAVFPRSLSKDLLPGAKLTVLVDGVPTPQPGTVAEIMPRAPEGDQARYFVPFPPIEKNEIYLIAKLNKPLPDLRNRGSGSTDRCALGHWAKVSLDRPWFTRLI